MPDIFYKYMSFNTAQIVLKNQTLRWTTPTTLNDPYDIQFDLRVDFNREKVMESALEKLWKVYTGDLVCSDENMMGRVIKFFREKCPNIDKTFFTEQMTKGIAESFKVMDGNIKTLNKFVRATLSTSKILCLTDSPTNQLMWAYYADSNRGVVLQFEEEDGADSPYKTAKKVKYQEEIPSLFYEDELSDFLAGLITFDQQRRVDDLIYTKSAAWAHEREWRIYSGDGRNKDAPHEDIVFGSKELTGVILGCRMPEADRSNLSALIRRSYPDAEILQASIIDHKYEIELKKTKY